MINVLSFSGGAGSFAAGVLAQKAGKQFTAVFCDTLIEDADLYRFLVDAARVYCPQVEVPPELVHLVADVPPVGDLRRHACLAAAREIFNHTFNPAFYWLADGRDPYQVFRDRRYMGNTRTAHCSVELKAKVFKRWLRDNGHTTACLIMGFDWAESHRHDEAVKNWQGYEILSPLCAPPYLNRNQILAVIDDHEIELPRLYLDGFTHNNCGGWCVKAGKKQFKQLLAKRPALYWYHANKQDNLHADLPTTRPFLRSKSNGVQTYITLRQFAESTALQDATEEGTPCACFSDGVAELNNPVTLE